MFKFLTQYFENRNLKRLNKIRLYQSEMLCLDWPTDPFKIDKEAEKLSKESQGISCKVSMRRHNQGE